MMEFVVNDREKRVEIWLTRAEKEDALLRESLKPILSQCKTKKYLVVFFESGEQDLFTNTRDLLLSNKQKLADIV